MSKWIRLTVIGVMLVAGLAWTQAGDIKVAGEGELNAIGTGIAIVVGSGTVKIAGTGCLWYKGDSVLVTSEEVTTETIGKWTLITNFKGSASAKGTGLYFALSGKNISLETKGKGKVMLWGEGSYSVHGKTGKWQLKYLPIPYTEGKKEMRKTRDAEKTMEAEEKDEVEKKKEEKKRIIKEIDS